MDNEIDPTIKALVSSIGEAETGTSSPEAYTKKGASGEYGRYQMMPETYKARAQKYLGDANAMPSIENQNKIQYEWVKEMKGKGYNPAQIASMQNAGEGEPDAYKGTFTNGRHTGMPSTGTNDYGAQYDVPAYTQKVSAAYERLKQQQGVSQQTHVNPDGSFLGDVGKDIAKAGHGISDTIGRMLQGDINPISGLLQSAGAVGGGIGDLTDTAISHIPVVGDAYKGITGLIGKEVGAALNTETGQKVVAKGQEFAQNHPEASGNIGAVANIASVVPVLKGVGVAKKLGTAGVREALAGSGEKVAAKALGASTPSLGDVKKGIKAGLIKQGKHGPTLEADKAMTDSVKHLGEEFNSGRLKKTSRDSEIAVHADEAADLEAQALEKRLGSEEIQTVVQPEELHHLMQKVVERSGQSITSGEDPAKSLMDIFAKNLPKDREILPVDILKARKAVGKFVRDNRGDWSQRGVLTGFKSARDAFWDESRDLLERIAPGSKASLEKQSALYRAAESMAPKVRKEIIDAQKSTFMTRHPVIRGLVKTGGRAIAEGTGIGAMMRIID